MLTIETKVLATDGFDNGYSNRPSPSSGNLIEASRAVWEEARSYAVLKSDGQESEHVVVALDQVGKDQARLYTLSLNNDIPDGHIRLPYPSFGREEISLKVLAACPVLTQVILSTSDQDTYRLAKRHIRSWSTHLHQSNRIISQDEILDLGNWDGANLRVTVTSSRPFLQGKISKDSKLIVAISRKAPLLNGSPSSLDNELDIEESFLSNTIAGPSLTYHGNDVQASSINGDTAAILHCQAQPLRRSDYSALRLDGNDPDALVVLSIAQLAKFGIFNGDWVEIATTDVDQKRLVKAQAGPSDLGHGTTHQMGQNHDRIWVSPTLLHNLFPKKSRDVSNELGFFVILKKVEAQDVNGPVIAKAMTISTIASPLTQDKRNTTALDLALRQEFETKRKVVKVGDVICVPIAQSLLEMLNQSNRNVSEEDGDQQEAAQNGNEKEGQPEPRDKEAIFHLRLPGQQEKPTSAIFFRVDDIQGETADDEVNRRGTFLIDPAQTRLVHAGTTNSLVVNWEAMERPKSYTSIFDKLMGILSASLQAKASAYDLQVSILISGRRGSGKRSLGHAAASLLGLHFLELNCYDLLGETDVKTEALIQTRMEKAVSCRPCIVLLRHIDALARKNGQGDGSQEPKMVLVVKECIATLRRDSASARTGQYFPVIVVGTTSEPEKVSASMLNCFDTEIKMNAPEEMERLEILKALTDRSGCPNGPDVSLKSVATQTAGLVARDLVELHCLAVRSLGQHCHEVSPQLGPEEIRLAGYCLSGQDYDFALNQVRKSYSDSIGAPKIPNVTWDDVGGLADVKEDILDTIQLPMDHPELFAGGLKKRSGILLYGPPGTGKTLLAKAVATSCSLNFFSIKGPELLNMYIGESEANVRRVFAKARDAKPCVIFFDELDSVAPKRGNQGDSGGVMDRIVSQLLAELDGMSNSESAANVFVIGATNRPDLLDPALLRPGRFDKMLFLSVADTHEAQYKIIYALTRKFRLDSTLDLRQVAEQCPFNLTGADFYALCSDALLNAMTRFAQEIDGKVEKLNEERKADGTVGKLLSPQYYLENLATPSEIRVMVGQADFDKALREMTPSVSETEMEHYRQVQRNFSGSTINSTKGILGNAETEVKGKGKGRA